uniref:Uncharacterized protein n=1 Tax=Ignisphaera aggregans TaxID=334771 RepID=A0A7C2V9D2_9CREN
MKKDKRKISLKNSLNLMIYDMLSNADLYFDKRLVLNSEGRKLLAKISKTILVLYPELKPLITKIRSDPKYEYIIELASKIREMASAQDNA